MLATLVTVANAVVLDERVFWGGAAITKFFMSLLSRLDHPDIRELLTFCPQRAF